MILYYTSLWSRQNLGAYLGQIPTLTRVNEERGYQFAVSLFIHPRCSGVGLNLAHLDSYGDNSFQNRPTSNSYHSAHCELWSVLRNSERERRPDVDMQKASDEYHLP